ncbi:MAG: hypothetical protein QM756_36005 [Polyangiaceae bacterium]
MRGVGYAGAPTPSLLKLLIALSILFAAIGTSIRIVKAFGAVGGESFDPSQKARILAEGISQVLAFVLMSKSPT